MTVLEPQALQRGDLRIVYLGPSDLDRLYALHAALHRDPDQAGQFVHETRDFFRQHLGEHGRVLGLIADGGALVGYSVLGLPDADDPDNFGADIGLPAGERGRVAHLDGTGIHPAWRGLGLQRALIRERLRICEGIGRTIALSTAAPPNRRSLGNLLAAGLIVVALVTKYSSERFVLRQDVDRPVPVASAAVGPCVPLPESARHQALLSASWRGIALRDRGGEPCLVYADPSF